MSQIFGAALPTPESLRVIVGTSTLEIIPETLNPLPIGKIHLCNATGGAIAFDLEIFDGTTSFFIEKGRTLDANKSHEIRDEVLQAGESLRAKSSVAASLHVHVIKTIVTR